MIRAITVFPVLAIFGATGFGFEVGDVIVVIDAAEPELEGQTSEKVFPGWVAGSERFAKAR